MPLKKLKHITYRLIEQKKYFDIYHPENCETANRKAIIFCHASMDGKQRRSSLMLGLNSPSFAYLAPAGYELFAVKGHLSDYKTSELFDHCYPNQTYTDNKLLPPLSEIFSLDEDSALSLLTVHNDFDAIIIKQPLMLSNLIEQHEGIQAYQEVLFHCSRCNKDELSIKYFLPVEQHAHILAQNKPLDWSCF